MAYKAVTMDTITRLEQEYQALADGLQGKHHRQKALDETEMVRKGNQAETEFERIAKLADENFAERQANAKSFHDRAAARLKRVQSAAVDFRKDPSTKGNAKLVMEAAQIIKDIKKEYDDDGDDYAVVLAPVRDYNKTVFPQEYREDFMTARAKVINGGQAILAFGNQIADAEKEAIALVDIVKKAAMKSGIKKGIGTQRDISVAQTEAREFAKELETALAQLKAPSGMTAKPSAIPVGAMSLAGVVKDTNLLKTKRDLVSARGFWTNTEAAYKGMVTKLASMEKIVATKTRGFRSNELSNSVVKAEVAKAATAVKNAKAEIKKYDKDFANAKKAIVLIEAAAKKKGIS